MDVCIFGQHRQFFLIQSNYDYNGDVYLGICSSYTKQILNVQIAIKCVYVSHSYT